MISFLIYKYDAIFTDNIRITYTKSTEKVLHTTYYTSEIRYYIYRWDSLSTDEILRIIHKR